MKRQEYVIRWGGESAVKYAWNSAKRFVKKTVQEKANALGEDFGIVLEENKKDRWDTIYGKHVWRGNRGTEIIFIIERV